MISTRGWAGADSRLCQGRSAARRRVPAFFGILCVLAVLAACATVQPLTSRDMPPDYDPMSDEQMQAMNLVPGTTVPGTDFTIDRSQGFIRVKPFSMVVFFTYRFKTSLEKVGWDTTGGLSGAMTEAFTGSSTSNIQTRDTGTPIGEGASIRITWNQVEQGLLFDAEMIMFRRGESAVFLMNTSFHGEEAPDLVRIARLLDSRLKDAR